MILPDRARRQPLGAKSWKFTPITVWATWRGPGWTPCLWSVRKQDAVENCDPDERAIRVRVTLTHGRKRRASPSR